MTDPTTPLDPTHDENTSGTLDNEQTPAPVEETTPDSDPAPDGWEKGEDGIGISPTEVPWKGYTG